MKRRWMLTVFCMLMSLVAVAQSGLHVNALFDGRYRKAQNAVEVLVKGKSASKIKLNVYRSLSLTVSESEVNEVERLVSKDGVTAVEKEEEYRNGKLYYGFYTLCVVNEKGKKQNRYLFYLNQNLANRNPVNKVTLIFMEGWASAEYIKNLIRK